MLTKWQWVGGVSDALDMGTEAVESQVDILVTSVNLVDVVDDAHAVG